jgi:predicted ferric reductase
MVMRPWQAVTLVVAVSSILVLLAVPADTWPTTATLSLASGVAALALMATAAILGGRWPWVESVFGGLDRVYNAHKWLAVWALSLASAHLVFKAGMRGWDTAAILALEPEWTRLVRQASFVGLMLIVTLALNRNIPYSAWRWWHRLSGPLFLIVALHWLSIKSPLPLASPAGVWLAALTALGLAAAAYKLLAYPFLARHAEYRVTAAAKGASAVELELEPVGRGIAFKPGHFGFLRMRADGLREPHPFTIAAAPSPGGRIRFVIRALGDYTAKLVSGAEVGMHADVYAPYGRFERSAIAGREIWIGGGVGISPFIAWLSDPQAQGLERVTLFYFYTPGRAFPDVETLRATAAARGVDFMPVASGPDTPAFVERFSEIVRGADLATLDIAVCGPKGLLDRVRAQATSHGVAADRVRHELFVFR